MALHFDTKHNVCFGTQILSNKGNKRREDRVSVLVVDMAANIRDILDVILTKLFPTYLKGQNRIKITTKVYSTLLQ